MVLVGITHDDTEDDAAYLADKVVNLRIFDDSEGKMNLSLVDIGGEILSVSQFTLYGDTKKGRRPNYMNAAKPDKASLPKHPKRSIKSVNSLRNSGVKKMSKKAVSWSKKKLKTWILN